MPLVDHLIYFDTRWNTRESSSSPSTSWIPTQELRGNSFPILSSEWNYDKQQPKCPQNYSSSTIYSGFNQIFSSLLQECPLQPRKSQMRLQWMEPPATEKQNKIQYNKDTWLLPILFLIPQQMISPVTGHLQCWWMKHQWHTNLYWIGNETLV